MGPPLEERTLASHARAALVAAGRGGGVRPLPPDGWIDGVIDLILHDRAAGELWIVDWKTNRRLAGESDDALLGRLAADYQRQLAAYGASASGSFPGCTVGLWVYSTVAGHWSAVGVPS